MSSKPLPRASFLLVGVGMILALMILGWVASSRREPGSVRAAAAVANSPAPDDATPAPPPAARPPAEGRRRDEPQGDDPFATLFGAAMRVADQATQVATGDGDEKSLQGFIEAAADGVRAGLDVADEALPPLDVTVAKEFGDTFRGSVLSAHPRITDPRVIDLVMPVWDEVVHASRERPNSLTITLVEDPAVNAFAFVGRNVVVNRGFIDFAADCSRTKDTIRFVLAHELGHIVCGHTDTLFRRVVAAEQIVPGAGVAPAIIESVVKQTPISQAAEREADCFARRMHVDHGWSLEGGREFFTRVQRLAGRPASGSAIESLLGSHPDEGRRLQLLETGAGCSDN